MNGFLKVLTAGAHPLSAVGPRIAQGKVNPYWALGEAITYRLLQKAIEQRMTVRVIDQDDDTASAPLPLKEAFVEATACDENIVALPAGNILLIPGNGIDTISNYSLNDRINTLVEEVRAEFENGGQVSENQKTELVGDVLNDLADRLEQYDDESERVKIARALALIWSTFDNEDAQQLAEDYLDEMIEALDEYAPPLHRFTAVDDGYANVPIDLSELAPDDAYIMEAHIERPEPSEVEQDVLIEVNERGNRTYFRKVRRPFAPHQEVSILEPEKGYVWEEYASYV